MHYSFSKPVQVLGWICLGLSFYAAGFGLLFLIGRAAW
jgi:hypothetical protein